MLDDVVLCWFGGEKKNTHTPAPWITSVPAVLHWLGAMFPVIKQWNAYYVAKKKPVVIIPNNICIMAASEGLV